MAALNLSDTVDERTTELRALRRLINAPTQRIVDELVRHVRKLHADVYTPAELTNLLVPIINEVLQKRIAANERQVTVTLSPLIDKLFSERTHQDRSAMVNALAPTVAKALREQYDKFPGEVAEDLAPLMGDAIREQVREQRDAMVDALYPIIGSTIAKYMAEALRQLAENVNKKVESAFSFGGLMRKVKSKATGVSEAELLMGESLPFTVEAAFLIHKKSGIMISEARHAGIQLDSDLVAGMLTAIRSFVNNWIAQAGDVSEIDAIQYGRSKIILEVAGHCYLAIVVEGEPRTEFVRRVRATLAQIVEESDREIAAFQGEVSFVPTSVHERVRSLLDENRKPLSGKRTQRSLARTLLPLAAILALLIGAPLGWHYYRQQQNENMEQKIRSAIEQAIGFHPTSLDVNVSGDDVAISGILPNSLLASRARETAIRTAQTESPSSRVSSSITASMPPPHPSVVAAHVEMVTAAFNKIDGVGITSSYKEGHATLSGTVSDRALGEHIVAEIERLPGISSLSHTFRNRKPTIDARIYFLRSTEFTEDATQKLREIRNLLEQYPTVNLRIIGHSDELGTLARNLPLTLARAVAVRDALVQLGVAENRLLVEGEGRPVPGLDPASPENRCVRFQTIESRSPTMQ
jgi:outer membrane protein OmpA-like peptidoglycan-associated protein